MGFADILDYPIDSPELTSILEPSYSPATPPYVAGSQPGSVATGGGGFLAGLQNVFLSGLTAAANVGIVKLAQSQKVTPQDVRDISTLYASPQQQQQLNFVRIALIGGIVLVGVYLFTHRG